MAFASSKGPSAWPLVGREGELERIRDAFAAGASGVVVNGPPGVGKTRLARAALEEARAGGAYVAWARATRSSSAVPLGALGTLAPVLTRPTDGAGFIQEIVSALHEQAAGSGIVIGVDDAQWLDPASATVLLYAAEHSVALVIATIRAGDPRPDAITALWKDAGSVRVELGVLGEADLAELVEVVLGGPLQHDAHRWIAQNSQGNLLYAQQLLESAIDSKALTRTDGVWRLTHRPAPSPSLSELVAARMGTLSDAQRRGLELLTLGGPFTLAEATELIGSEALAELEANLLAVVEATSDGVGAVHVAHPLYGELISAEMPVSRAREHRMKLVELVGTRSEPSPADAVRVALWLTDAGEPTTAEILLDAARAANLAGIEVGASFAQRALEAGAGPEASLLLAAAHSVHGRPAEAEAVLADVEGKVEDRALALRYARERASVLQWGLDRPRDTVAFLDRALAWWPDERWRGQIAILRLPFASLIGEPGATSQQIEQALENQALDGDWRRWLQRALAADRFWAGRVEESRALLGEMPRIPLQDNLDFLEFVTHSVVGLACGSNLVELEGQMRDAFERATEAPDPAAAGLAAFTVAATSYLAGRFLDCRRWLNEAVTQSARQDPFGTLLIARSLQVGVALALGEHSAAMTAAERLQANLVTATAAPPANGSWVTRGRAWAMLAAADAQQAQELLLTAADGLERSPTHNAELRYEAMRAGRSARELAPGLQALSERCDAPLTRAYSAHANARADGDAAGMLAAAETFAALGVHHYGSEAAAHAAAAFAAEGRQDSARRAAARSRSLQPAEQGSTPVPIEGVDQAPTELTPREAQMVQLAARGLTNAEIAEQLVLSTRTVETHIYRAMRKLGINDRREFSSQAS